MPVTKQFSVTWLIKYILIFLFSNKLLSRVSMYIELLKDVKFSSVFSPLPGFNAPFPTPLPPFQARAPQWHTVPTAGHVPASASGKT